MYSEIPQLFEICDTFKELDFQKSINALKTRDYHKWISACASTFVISSFEITRIRKNVNRVLKFHSYEFMSCEF